MKPLKILILIIIISYSLVFWILYTNDIILGFGFLRYLKDIFTHLETLAIFPATYMLIKTLQSFF